MTTTPLSPAELREMLEKAADARDSKMEMSHSAHDHLFGRNLYREALEELERVRKALEELVRQVEISAAIDNHGHLLANLNALADARAALAHTTRPSPHAAPRERTFEDGIEAAAKELERMSKEAGIAYDTVAITLSRGARFVRALLIPSPAQEREKTEGWSVEDSEAASAIMTHLGVASTVERSMEPGLDHLRDGVAAIIANRVARALAPSTSGGK